MPLSTFYVLSGQMPSCSLDTAIAVRMRKIAGAVPAAF